MNIDELTKHVIHLNDLTNAQFNSLETIVRLLDSKLNILSLELVGLYEKVKLLEGKI